MEDPGDPTLSNWSYPPNRSIARPCGAQQPVLGGAIRALLCRMDRDSDGPARPCLCPLRGWPLARTCYSDHCLSRSDRRCSSSSATRSLLLPPQKLPASSSRPQTFRLSSAPTRYSAVTEQQSRVYQFGERQANYFGISLASVDEFISTLEINQLKAQAASLIRNIGSGRLILQASTSQPSLAQPSKFSQTLATSWSPRLCYSR